MYRFHLITAAALLLAACHAPPSHDADQAATASDSMRSASTTAPAAPNSGLTSGEWALVALFGQPAPLGAEDRPATLAFEPDSGRVSGFAGCNRIFGGYALTGSSLSFGPLGMTRMACDKGMDLEHRYATALDSVRSYRVTGDTLELLGEDGATLARLQRRSS